MNTPLIAGLAVTATLLGFSGAAHAADTYRSPTTATWLSLGGLAASGLTIAAGAGIGGDTGITVGIVGAGSLLLTPSLGQFYSGDYLSRGLLARGAGTGLMALGTGLWLRGAFGGGEGGAVLGFAMMGAGATSFVVGTILDLTLAGTSAEKFNAKHGFRLAPTAISTPSGTSAGLGFSGRF